MSARLASLLVVIALLAASLNSPLAAPLNAKDKKKPVLPEYVLRARTVRVVIAPDSGEPLEQPMANSTARDNVEKALSEWGRYQVVMDGQESDLVIAVRTGSGKMVQPTIKGGPIDQRGGVAQGTDSTIRIGGAQGHPPGSDPTMNPQDQGPHMSNEIGPSDDTFEVYRGNTADALDAPPVWRYIAKDCLRAPNIRAVEEFRKAIADSEKPQVPQPKQP
jgi:hypothetical protein